MACITGECHTISIAENGEVYAFGQNSYGELGLGNDEEAVFIPTRITNLPSIYEVSCGCYFTVCVAYDGSLWSFGENYFGQLGIPKEIQKYFYEPQLIEDIPPVISVSCGAYHTVFITSDLNLWSCGNNNFGQLCLEHTINQSPPQQTSFSNIAKIASGFSFTLFQNNKGEIFGCGQNNHGEIGLGHFNDPQIIVSSIPNLPPNIVQFACGFYFSLFLDEEGRVFSVGCNNNGSLGVGNVVDQNILLQILNIPPIKTISCAGDSSYLLDCDGNVWTFGCNRKGGPNISPKVGVPAKIAALKGIQQISCGTCSFHFLAKDSRGKLFALGANGSGQLGIGTTFSPSSAPQELDPEYHTIWGETRCIKSNAKSARK